LSHTNVGKTTLARTLLRADIGAVMDRAHVTETAEAHVLMRTRAGDEVVLWDTPGFGDSVRLLRRLERGDQPLGWFLSQVWDRLADRPFWCGQQALRAARDGADVLLYVANATEDPATAGYVAPEVRILRWLGKPTLILLNQLGTRADAAQEAEIARRWREILERESPGLARDVLPFDAFGRCWLHEHGLFEALEACLGPEQRAGFARCRDAWAGRDRDVLQASADVIARQLEALVRDEERLADADSLADKLRRAARSVAGGSVSVGPAEERAQRALLQRLDAAIRSSTVELVGLHGLAGGAGEEILACLDSEFSTERAPDPDQVGLLGGLVSGALGGLAADLAAGGLTLGAGALLGGVVGALGARKLTQRYNAGRGLEGGLVRWSDEFLDARLEAALVRYLAVGHYGRGRGEFRQSEPDPRWRDAARHAVLARQDELRRCWREARTHAAAQMNSTAPENLRVLVADLLRASLTRLYPEAAARFFGK